MARRRSPRGGKSPLPAIITVLLGFIAYVGVSIFKFLQSIPLTVWIWLGAIFVVYVAAYLVWGRKKIAKPQSKNVSAPTVTIDPPVCQPAYTLPIDSKSLVTDPVKDEVILGRESTKEPEFESPHTGEREATPIAQTQTKAMKSSNDMLEGLISLTIEVGSVPQKDFTIPPPPSGRKKANSATGMKCRWVPHGESFTLAGITIPDGMIYVGNNQLGYGQEDEPSRIDPELPIATVNKAFTADDNEYWPSYRSISPSARRGYLQWLADGRNDLSAPITFVFLFYYGLERRLFIDSPNDSADELERLFIIAEIKRLRSLYGSNYSFNGYSTKLLDYLQFSQLNDSIRVYEMEPPEFDRKIYTAPMAIEMCLGHLVRDKRLLPASWAFAWAMSHPETYLRTPATRCPAEFKRAFEKVYKDRFGDGMKLQELKARIELHYSTASLQGNAEVIKLDLSDMTGSKACRNALVELVDASTNLIDPFSRYLGRYPGQEHTFEAQLLLPDQLRFTSFNDSFRSLRDEVGTGLIITNWGTLRERFEAGPGLKRDQRTRFFDALAEHNLYVIPESLASAKSPAAEDTVIVMHGDASPVAQLESPLMRKVVIALDLACILSRSDSSDQGCQAKALVERIGEFTSLSSTQTTLLTAKAILGMAQPPALAAVRKMVVSLDHHDKAWVTQLLVDVAKSDGIVSPAEVAVLEKIYKLLSLDGQSLYSDIHSGSATLPAAAPEFGQTPVKPPAFTLDRDRIAQLQDETKSVAAMLATVFTDEPLAVNEPAQSIESQRDTVQKDQAQSGSASEGARVLGLDPRHSSLLMHLLSRPEWARTELESFAKHAGLMLDGALEQINEAMLDLFDEMLIEGDDPIEINQDLLEQIPHD